MNIFPHLYLEDYTDTELSIVIESLDTAIEKYSNYVETLEDFRDFFIKCKNERGK